MSLLGNLRLRFSSFECTLHAIPVRVFVLKFFEDTRLLPTFFETGDLKNLSVLPGVLLESFFKKVKKILKFY